jgi:hypothetical protein
MPVPAEFKTLEEAKLYQRELNLHRALIIPVTLSKKRMTVAHFFRCYPEDRHERS